MQKLLAGNNSSAPSLAMALPNIRAARASAKLLSAAETSLQSASGVGQFLSEAATACNDMSQMLENWACDIEGAIVETLH